MAYINNGVSESLMKKLSSAKNTAQSSIKKKKYDTSNISLSLAQKLGLNTTSAKGGVSRSGDAAVNLRTQENVNKANKFLKENPEYMYNGKSLVKNPAIINSEEYKLYKANEAYSKKYADILKETDYETQHKNLDNAYNTTTNEEEKAWLDAQRQYSEHKNQLALREKYWKTNTYKMCMEEAEKAPNETEKNYLLAKAQELKTRKDYEEEISKLKEELKTLEPDRINTTDNLYQSAVNGAEPNEIIEKPNKLTKIKEVKDELSKLESEYDKAKTDLSKGEFYDFAMRDVRALTTFEQLYNIGESVSQNVANPDEAVPEKFEVNTLYSDEEQQKIKNDYAELENKYGKTEIENLYKWFKRIKEEDKSKYNLEIAEERAKLNPFLGSLESIGAEMGTLSDSVHQAGVWLSKTLFGGDGYYDPNATNAMKSEVIRGTVSEGIDNEALKWLYDNGMSLVDSGISMAYNYIPVIGPGLSYATNYARGQAHSFNDTYLRTGSVNNAFLTGLAHGTAELIFEKLSIDQLKAFKAKGVTSLKGLGINIAKSTAVEGSEELFTEIANTVTDQIINQDLSTINVNFDNYIAQGYSEEEAWNKVKADYLAQLGSAFAGGAFGGLVFGGGVSGYSYASYKRNSNTLNPSSKEMGQAVIDSGADAVQEVIYNCLQAEEGSKTKKLATKLNQIIKSGKEVNPSDIGNLLKLQETDSVNVQAIVSEGLKEKVDTPAHTLATKLQEQIDAEKIVDINTVRALQRELGVKKVSRATDYGVIEYKDGVKGDVEVNISSTIHPNGIIAKTKNGKKVIIAQLESADSKTNVAKILTTDGAVIDASTLSINDHNFRALLNAAENFDTNGAKALVANYEKAIEEVGEISGREYAEHFYNLYEASKEGSTFEQAKNVPNLQISMNHIGAYASVLAMRSAQNDLNPLTKHWKNSVSLVKEVTSNDNTVKLNSEHIYADENVDVSNEGIVNQIAMLDALAKKANIDIVLSSELSENENGRYEDGRIVINANKPSEYITAVVMHEVGHDIKANNPEAFETLTDFVLDYLKAKNVDIEQRITQIKRQYKRVFNPDTAREMAVEELVCNTLMSIPSEQEAMNVLAEMDIKEKRSLLKALKDFIQRIKNYLKKYSLTETKAFIDDFEAINKLANMVNESIVQERQNTNQKDLYLVEDNVSYSLEKTYQQQVDDVLSGDFDKKNHVYMGNTPHKLVGILGIKDLPLLITSNHIYSMTVSEEKAKSDGKFKKNVHYHNLGSTLVKSLPDALNNPLMIIKSNTKNNDAAFVVITNLLDKNNKPVFVPIKPSGKGKYYNIEIDSNVVLTSYGKDKFNNYIFYAQKENRILFVDKKSSQQIKNILGVQFPNNILNVDYSNNLSHFKKIVNDIILDKSSNYAKKNSYFSLNKNTDIEYISAVESEDMKKAQRFVDNAAEISFANSEVRDTNGKLLKVYHGTDSENFNVFDKSRRGQTDSGVWGRGYYFLSDYDYATDFGDNVRSFYLNIENPYYVSKVSALAKEIGDYLKSQGVDVNFDYNNMQAHEFVKHFGNQHFTDVMTDLGYDGVIIDDFEYLVFNRNQMKLTDPVTYDDDGNIIPLSERFDDSKVDIRYSLTEPGDITDAEVRDLFEDNEEAFDYDFATDNIKMSHETKEAIKDTIKTLVELNTLTQNKRISDNDLRKLCKQVIQKCDSKQNLNVFVNDMKVILNALEQCQTEEDFNAIFFEMVGLFKNVLDKSLTKVDNFQEESEVIKALLKDYGRIKVDMEQVAEIASAFDGYNNFRKKMFGFANLIKSDNPNSYGCVSLDMVWSELSEMYPYLCDPDVNPLEIPMAMLELKEKLKPTYEHTYLNMDEQALEMAQVFLANIYDGKYTNDKNTAVTKQKKLFNEKLAQQKKKQEEKFNKMVRDQNEQFKQRKKELEQKIKDAEKLKGAEEYVKKLKKTLVTETQYEIKIVEVNAKNANKVMALYDQKKATEAREEIRKMLTKVARWGVNPNKNAYMPAEFANAFRDLLKVFTVKPKGEAVPKIYEPLNRLRTQYIELGKNRPENYNDLFKENGIENLPEVLSYSKEIRETLDELCEKFKNADIYHISGKELREIASTLKSIINSIENSRTMIVEGKAFEITKFAMGCINELQSTSSKVDNILMKTLHNYELEKLSPQRIFRHWGNYDENSNIYKLGEMLNRGQRKAMDYRRDFTMIFNESIANNKKYFKTITGSTAEIIDTGMIINGKKIEITKGMALSLYLNCRNPDNMYHIIHGGVTFPDTKLYKKGKVKESYSRKKATPLTFGDIKKICAIVENDPILMEFAKLVNTLFEKQAVEINKTSVLLFGYEAATIENYFPIISDENFLNKDIDALIFDSTLAGNGSLKHRVRSKNPILLTDVFDVVMKQIDWVSDFCGLAIPISNFMKVYNTTIKDDNSIFSFKEELERVWGLKAKSYLENLITKLQTNRSHHNITDRFRGNFAQAVLTMNPRTGLINLSAYPVAASIIGHKPLIKAMKKGFKRAPLELINKYTSIMWYRTQGEKQIHLLSKIRGAFDKNYEPLKNQTELGDVLQKKKLFKRLFDNMQWLTHWIQKADSAVVGRLWFACEYYVNDNYADLEKGTDDYYMQVAEIFIKVVEETQQNYAVMQSPVILNNTDTIFKEAFLMFKSQSLQEFGLIFEATGNLRAKTKAYSENKTEANKEALKQAKRQFANTISGRVVSTVLYVALGFIAAFALNKTDRLRDENGEITLMSFGSAFANEFFANLAGLFIGGDELYNFIYALIARENYYPVGLSSVEYLFEIPKDAYNLIISLTDEERDIEKIVNSIKNFVFDGSVVTGLPTKNLWDIVSAIYSHGQDIINGTMLSPDYANMANSQKAIAMYNSLMNGDREKYAKIYNTFISQGKEDSDIQSYLKTVLESRNPKVEEAAQAYINNSYDIYENKIMELEEIGFATKTIKSAINAKIKDLTETEKTPADEAKTYTVDEIFDNNKESIYDKDMLWQELIEGDAKNYAKVYAELLESGLTEKQIEQSINSRKRSLTEKYVEAVEEGQDTTAAEYYQQLVNAYGSNSKANKAIREEEKKDKEKD